MRKPQRIQRSNVLLDATIRDFSGAWNTVDEDLNLATKFSRILENMQRSIGGSNSVRPGTRLFADVSSYMDTIINCEFYNNHIICVGSNGKIVRINSSGTIILIWDDSFAENLPGAPDAWGTTFFVSFAIFNGELIIANGINKPLIVHSNMNCEYLHDPNTGSNANTPIARFVVTHGRYLVMGGSLTEGEEDTLFISNTDTSGVWLNDDAPNDAVNLSLGSRVPSGSSAIKGIGRFRDKLLVMFENAVLPGTLGTFVSTVHIPDFDDAIEDVGCLSHRSIQATGEDLLFCDQVGVVNFRRALFTGNLQSERESQLISPDYLGQIDLLDTTGSQEDRIWGIWDSQATNYMLFVPNHSTASLTTETRCFTYKKDVPLKINAWHDWRDWNFRSGCRSTLKKVFLTRDAQVFLLGEDHKQGTQIFKDYEGSEEMYDDNTVFTDNTGWTPVADANDSGIPINFRWELPWSDNNQRFLTKTSRFINFDTVGTNSFIAQMFIDNIYLNAADRGEDFEEDELKFNDEFGWDVDVYDPTLSMQFEGGSNAGFGVGQFGQAFGGGRNTQLEQLYAWPSKYKLSKLKIYGAATKELRFVSITMAYQVGSPRR